MINSNEDSSRWTLRGTACTIAVLMILTAWADLVFAGIGNATLTYGNNQVTFSVSNDDSSGGHYTSMWYQIHDPGDACDAANIDLSAYTNNLESYSGSGQTYSKTFTGNDGKEICVFGSGTNLFETRTFAITYPDTTAPKFSSAIVDGLYLVINFDEPMKTTSTPAASAFSVSGVSGLTVSSLSLSSTYAVLTLSSAVTSKSDNHNQLHQPGRLISSRRCQWQRHGELFRQGGIKHFFDNSNCDGRQVLLEER